MKISLGLRNIKIYIIYIYIIYNLLFDWGSHLDVTFSAVQLWLCDVKHHIELAKLY